MNGRIDAGERRRVPSRSVKMRRLRAALLAFAAASALAAGAGRAETLGGALVKAYLNNPDINSQRATVRQTDENVPIANSGYLPKISATGTLGVAHTNGNQVLAGSGGPEATFATGAYPRSYGIEATQNVFDGYQTINRIRNAESNVMAVREQLRFTEQNTLLTGVTDYMDVLRDTAILELQRNNVLVLQEQLRETRDRFTVGEVTRTDVAQAEASLASSQATELSAEATLSASIARYRQTIGDEPKTLAPVRPIAKPVPRTLAQAITISQVEHPAITAQLLGTLTLPIYQGGADYATIRHSKENLSVQELHADSLRDQIRQAVVSAWGLNQASVGIVRAARASVAANEVALAGVREEAKVGQRTTLDVLNAQQALLAARSNLVSAEHDQVVNSYSLLSQIGRLNVPTLGLGVAEYDPRVHYDQVKTKWIGVRTPDGK